VHNITVSDLDGLPILGIGPTAAGASGIRNPYAIAQLIPGTFYQPSANVVINGAPSNTEALRVEGLDATNQLLTNATQETQAGVDAIQEVAIQTAAFASEFGVAGGGLFNVTMRSGSNQFHGSGYNYFVNEALNAGVTFTDNGHGDHLRPRARRNDYGFTLGGP